MTFSAELVTVVFRDSAPFWLIRGSGPVSSSLAAGAHANCPGSQNLVTTATFGAKAKSKKEVYLVLVIDAKAYLPSHTTITV